MKKIIWIILVLAVAAGIYLYIRKKNEHKPFTLITEHPQTGLITNSVTATGTIEPVDTVNVGSQVSGTIQNIYVDFNSTVKKGQMLASLDKSLLSDQVNEDIATLQNAQSTLLYQKQNFDRQTKLYKVGGISQADFETAQSTYSAALAGVNNAKATLAAAQKNLSYTNIYSPINGTILSRNVSAGQTVASSFSTPTLFSIAKDLTKMQVQAAVDEADVGNVKFGQQVNFTVDAFPDKNFMGAVQEVRLQPLITANVVTYTTIINAENNDLQLKPGMTANITIYLQQDSSAKLISTKTLTFTPDSSLTKKYQIIQSSETPYSKSDSTMKKSGSPFPPKHNTVWVLNGNQIVKKHILTGMNNNINVQVLSGLNDSDVVVDGIEAGAATNTGSAGVKSPFMPSRKSPPKKTATTAK